jgi:hypothetical protein
MKTWCGAGALLLGALISGGCAASSVQGAPVRVHTTTAAFEHSASSETAFASPARHSSRGGSPLARECKAGSSKACNEVGDRLVIKHAYAEATQWYMTSCQRVRGDMVPTAKRLLQLSRDIAQGAAAAKSDASEIRARIQGCFDTGEMLRAEDELKQALNYYEAACEFSTLVEAVEASVSGLEQISDNGCAATQAARAKLSKAAFTPQLFVGLAQEQAAPAQQGDTDMVFTIDE